jgi:uncharacterized membrane protein YfcA
MELLHILLITIFVFVISFLFSMIGLGGGQLYMPLFYYLGMELKAEAIPSALLLNFITIFSATLTYIRNKLIVIKEILPFVIAIIFSPFLGAYFAGFIPDRILLLIFALILIAVSLDLLIKRKQPLIIKSNKCKFIVGIIAGVLIGTMVGMLGRGSGSFVVPVLLYMGFAAKIAIGTASLMNALSSFTGFIATINTGIFRWYLIPFIVASIIGSQLGSRLMVKKMKAEALKKIFALIIGIVGLVMILHLIMG